jgi:toxin ParE1/3/4
MASFRLSRAAESDIVEILAWSEAEFGAAARRRYEHLITVALLDIASDPARPGSLPRPELGPGVRSWHLRASRERARTPGGAVRQPRHFVIYRLTETGEIAVGRVLHDAMELWRHIRDEDDWT